jgi:hypothetical protein
MNGLHHPARIGPILRTALGFFVILAIVFAEQSQPFWHGGKLLAGIHADGPFHYFCERVRLNPESYPGDIVVQNNRNLGAYEFFYASVTTAVKVTGLSLLNANLVLCWLGNILYLAGVMVLLRCLGARPGWAAIGTLLAAQPFVLIGMPSGVVHSLAIPRGVWQWPMPWFLTWFLFGERKNWHLLFFYSAIGAVFAFTYPLWAVHLGIGFGLADALRFVREKNWQNLLWLIAAGILCAGLVAIPSLATYRVTIGGGAVLDYNEITRSVYFSKGFRRLLFVAAAGCAALWFLRRRTTEWNEKTRRLQTLLLSALAVCLFYEPFQRLFPVLSLLYLGRLSLVVYLASVVIVTIVLNAGFRGFSFWGRMLTVAAILAVCLAPVFSLRNEIKSSVAAQNDFIVLCRTIQRETPMNTLMLAPPGQGAHYFRVYAERSLWISGKDNGVLSRSRTLYEEGLRRVKILRTFYDDQTAPSARAAILQMLKANGVDYVVVEADKKWAATLSWPVMFQKGNWQLRGLPAD